MPARALFAAPLPNKYLVTPRLTQRELLTVFYAHVLELARLLQASAVTHDLDPAEIARSEDRWSWSVPLPMQVEKLWAELQAVRKQVARARAARGSDEGAQPADADLVEGCMHLYHTVDAVVRHVEPQLAGWFVFRLLEIADHQPANFVQRIPVLSRSAAVATAIRRAWKTGAYQDALAMYFTAQIREELEMLRPRARM